MCPLPSRHVPAQAVLPGPSPVRVAYHRAMNRSPARLPGAKPLSDCESGSQASASAGPFAVPAPLPGNQRIIAASREEVTTILRASAAPHGTDVRGGIRRRRVAAWQIHGAVEMLVRREFRAAIVRLRGHMELVPALCLCSKEARERQGKADPVKRGCA